jgi:tripartite ATP-independent transporter DctM subunit
LGIANVVASMIFAGISGSAVGDTASIGGILIPAMTKEGYDAEFTIGVTASSSCLAPIIPPSIPMIVAGSCAGLSVGKLFIAGAVPGIIWGFLMSSLCIYFSYKRKYPAGVKTTLRQFFQAILDAFWALFMAVVILFGIMGGFFTPTEASIVAVLYALIVGKFVYKELKLRDVPAIISQSMVTAASILIITGFAAVFAWILTTEHIPIIMANAILSVSQNKWIILILINLLLLFVGMFMETISAILILFPILLNIAPQIGMDPIQFAVICVLNLVIGLCTPPVGVCLFLACNIGGISLTRGIKGIYPFILLSLAVLALVTIFPAITLTLPNLFSH